VGVPNPKYQFKKGNTAASAKKGKKHRRTIVKQKIEEALGWDNAEAQLEKVMMEALHSKSKKDRVAAARYFAEFIKPKKREIQKDYDEDRLIVNVIYGNPTEANAKNHPTP
jgi:hypothetical protein